MINIFLGFPGDGKTSSLLRFCHHDEVNKDSKLIIYDDSYLVGQSEKIKETCFLTDVEHIAQENIVPEFIHTKHREGKNIYIDTSSVVPISYSLEEVKLINPINKILVIDAMRILYFSGNNQLELYDYDTIIITKVDFLNNVHELAAVMDKIPEEMPLFISKGQMLPDFKKIRNRQMDLS